MKGAKKSISEKWTVSLIKLESYEGAKYKVTRKIPKFSISETEIFKTKEEALKKFNEWLED